jgi:hypothetical protein
MMAVPSDSSRLSIQPVKKVIIGVTFPLAFERFLQCMLSPTELNSKLTTSAQL